MLLLGVVMAGLGAYLAIRLLWLDAPFTRSRLLDAAFAGFFILRGVMNIRAASRASRREGKPSQAV